MIRKNTSERIMPNVLVQYASIKIVGPAILLSPFVNCEFMKNLVKISKPLKI